MREIHVQTITDAVARLVIEANCHLSDSVLTAIRDRTRDEPSPAGLKVLELLLENARIAAEKTMPICQDTGLTVVFADIGQEVSLVGGDFEKAVNLGIAKGYTEGFLRKSSVMDPLFDRKNTGDNTPGIVHMRIVPGKKLRLRVAPKGAGSENKGALAMLTPADGVDGVKDFVLRVVEEAGPSPCPPMVVGVGIGGNMEMACLCAKRAAVRDIGRCNPDPRYALLENELLDRVNRTGIGPEGLGGYTTALAVNIEFCATHIASLPVAVNINCHAARHAELVL